MEGSKQKVMLTTILKNFLESNIDNEKAIKSVGHALNEGIKYISQMPRGAARIRTIQKDIDKAMVDGYKEVEQGGHTVSCSKGCAHCCYQYVMCSAEEGEYIYKIAKERGIPLSKKKLAYQTRFARPSDYFAKFGKRTRCVFLNGKNECMIYDHRPIACRKYFVVSDPVLCKPNDEGGIVDVAIASNQRLIAIEALASALLNVDLMNGSSKETDNFSLPARLLERMKNDK